MNVKVSIERLCDEVGMTRQNFNKGTRSVFARRWTRI